MAPGVPFKPGQSGNPAGRPPNRYSITHALRVVGDMPQSVDDDGTPLTDAQLAARWLWGVVRTGRDERRSEDGGAESVAVSTKDRMAALQTILGQLEPTRNLDPSRLLDDEQAEEVASKLDNLSDDELALLEKIGVGKGKADQDKPDT